MSHRAGILGELMGPQKCHVLDPLHTSRVHIGRELCVTINGEALFQTELEPIPTGNTITREVMEVLVCNNRLHTLIAKVRGDIRVRQYTRGIEYIEALVLHRPHIEVIDGDNIEEIKIVLESVPLLVPAHGRFQRVHRMLAVPNILCFDPDAEIDRLTRDGRERVRN